jgi:hypothetical protein
MATMPTYGTTFRQAGRGYYRGADNKLISGNLMKTMTDRFNRFATDFGKLKQDDARYNAVGQNIRDLGTKYGFDYNKVLGANWKPWTAPTPPPPPGPEAAPAAPPAQEAPPQPPPSIADQMSNMQSYQSPMTQSLLNAMRAGTNTMAAYEPKNFEGSPLYQFQKQKGMADLEKLMSARGLTGSGAEVQANSDFLANLNATEAEKQRQFAEQEANRNQSMMQFVANYDMGDREALRNQLNTDLDRRIGQQQFEASRGDSRNALMTNFLQNILQMQSDNNIAQLSQAGLAQQSQYQQALMNALSQFTANAYPRYSGGGGGGARPQPPMGPELDVMRIMANYGNRAGNNDVFNGITRLLFPR